MPPEALAEASGRIVTRLSEVLPESSGAVALFWPLPGEIDLRPLAHHLRQRGGTVALPAVVGDRQIEWRQFQGAGRLAPGRWGLQEPPPDAPVVTPDAVAAVVVPGLAFGRDGSRLGMGGGFYDTALAQTEAARLGVVVDRALVDAVPTEPHDLRMDAVVTDHGVWRIPRP